MLIKVICKGCGKEFEIPPSLVKHGVSRCSFKCRIIKKVITKCLECGKEIKSNPNRIKDGRGKYCSRECRAKGVGKKQQNENNPFWKGNNIQYDGIHRWASSHFGKPDKCDHCGKDKLSKHQIQWASVDHKYSRDRSGWMRLCASCHKKYDLKMGLVKH